MPVESDVEELFREVCLAFWPTAQHHGCTLVVHVDPAAERRIRIDGAGLHRSLLAVLEPVLELVGGDELLVEVTTQHAADASELTVNITARASRPDPVAISPAATRQRLGSKAGWVHDCGGSIDWWGGRGAPLRIRLRVPFYPPQHAVMGPYRLGNGEAVAVHSDTAARMTVTMSALERCGFRPRGIRLDALAQVPSDGPEPAVLFFDRARRREVAEWLRRLTTGARRPVIAATLFTVQELSPPDSPASSALVGLSHCTSLRHVAQSLALLAEGNEAYPPSLCGLRVLVAEDNQTTRNVLGRMLEQLLADAILVADGQAAVEELDRTRIDAAVLDIRMPRVSGTEVLQAIRSRQPHVVALALSADATWGAQYQQAGFHGALVKPVSREALLKALQPSRQGSTAAIEGQGSEAEQLPLYDPEEAIRLAGGNAALAQEMLELFRDELRRHRPLFADTGGDPGDLRRAAHEIQGGAAYCGMPRLRRRAAELEEAAQHHDPAGQERGRRRLLATIDALLDASYQATGQGSQTNST